jgi:pimeloyl-ACP methyl ester carboxylesterase
MPDAQGHGLSDRLGHDFTARSHTDNVAGLARELGLEKPVLIGHSMGGGIAVDVAALYPELPGAIVLEDGGFHSPEPQDRDTGAERDGFVQTALAQAQLSVDELVAKCRKEHPAWPEDELIPWAEAKRQFDPDLFKMMRAGTPYQEKIKTIICPALLITADGGMIDDETAQNALDVWAADKPLRWVKINGAGHNIRREQYGAFSEALLGFLDSL